MNEILSRFITIFGLAIGLVLGITIVILEIIFIVRIWVIVRYHYYKIKDKEKSEKIKREYHKLIQDEKTNDEIIEIEE